MDEQSTGSGFDLNKPTIISLLYIASFFVGMTGIVGVILAVIWKKDSPEDWEMSHYIYHIRTFILGNIACIIGIILIYTLILDGNRMAALAGVFILCGIVLWTIIRSVFALTKAQKKETFTNPKTWWF